MKIDDFILETITTITIVVVIPLLSYLTKKIINFINKKIKSKRIRNLLIEVTDSTSRMVKEMILENTKNLKNNKDIVENIHKISENITNSLSLEVKELIIEKYGSIENYIDIIIKSIE